MEWKFTVLEREGELFHLVVRGPGIYRVPFGSRLRSRMMTTKAPPPHVLLTGWQPPVQKILLVKALRKHALLSLAEATNAVDRCLRGETVSIEIPSLLAAEALVRAVSDLGLRAVSQQPAVARPQG